MDLFELLAIKIRKVGRNWRILGLSLHNSTYSSEKYFKFMVGTLEDEKPHRSHLVEIKQEEFSTSAVVVQQKSITILNLVW